MTLKSIGVFYSQPIGIYGGCIGLRSIQQCYLSCDDARFFKALLFLGAGSVIHGLHGEQDLSKMGGLKGLMKSTHVVFLVATLAIVGCPPLAGFFPKMKYWQ